MHITSSLINLDEEQLNILNQRTINKLLVDEANKGFISTNKVEVGRANETKKQAPIYEMSDKV